MQKHKPLGEILREAGLITETHLKAALDGQQRWGGRVGEQFVKAGLIDENQLLDALSHQLGVARINFQRSRIYKEALQLIPKAVCEKYTLIPVAVRAEKARHKLLIAIADPTNFAAIQEVEFVSAHAVVTALASESQIRRAIDYCYHVDGLRECEGLPEDTDTIDLNSEIVGSDNEPIIINAEGEFSSYDARGGERALRVLIDLLIDRGIITREEFRTRLEKARQS